MADTKISALTGATTPLAGTEVVPVVQSTTTKKVSVANLTAGRAVSVGDLTLTGGGAVTTASEAYDYRYSTGGVGNNARVRYRTVYSGGGSGYGGSFELESRTSSNVWNTGAFTVTDAGNISTTGNLVIGTSGKGIDFSADSHAAGMTSELLDDYEEGTWTPDFKSGTNITYNSRSGTYVKVGNIVFLTANIDVSNNDTSDGSGIAIGDLPFAPSANNAAQFTFGLRRNFLSTKGNLKVGAWTYAAGFFLVESDNNYITYSECATSGILQFSAMYTV